MLPELSSTAIPFTIIVQKAKETHQRPDQNPPEDYTQGRDEGEQSVCVYDYTHVVCVAVCPSKENVVILWLCLKTG